MGCERFQVFVAQVGRRLASDHRLITEVSASIIATNPDLLADAIDDGPLTPRSPSAEVRPFTAKAVLASNCQAHHHRRRMTAMPDLFSIASEEAQGRRLQMLRTAFGPAIASLQLSARHRSHGEPRWPPAVR